jgi:predicted O-methyltransferase YrrM
VPKIAAMTPKDQWIATDQYFGELLLAPDPVLDAALADSAAAGLPSINVSPTQGKFLHLLALTRGARRILEVGTLGGYSTIWLARALPEGGRLVTLEFNPRHAEVARANLARAGLGGVVDLRLGRAIDTLPTLAQQGHGPDGDSDSDSGFDLIFIDADKPGTADYFAWAVKLANPGAVIVVDNVVRKGAVVDAASEDENVQGIRRFMQALAAERRVNATAIQTVGSKGYDGFVLAVVTAGR